MLTALKEIELVMLFPVGLGKWFRAMRSVNGKLVQ